MKEKQRRPECVVEVVPEDPSCPDGATDMYLIFDGRRIAKRGKPGTLHAMTWISLEPGVVVHDVSPYSRGDGMPCGVHRRSAQLKGRTGPVLSR
jgi:hypothetical protein